MSSRRGFCIFRLGILNQSVGNVPKRSLEDLSIFLCSHVCHGIMFRFTTPLLLQARYVKKHLWISSTYQVLDITEQLLDMLVTCLQFSLAFFVLGFQLFNTWTHFKWFLVIWWLGLSLYSLMRSKILKLKRTRTYQNRRVSIRIFPDTVWNHEHIAPHVRNLILQLGKIFLGGILHFYEQSFDGNNVFP